MITLSESEALAKIGVNPKEKINSEIDFQKQLESYAIHVIEDLPVSNIYTYRFDPKTQKIFTETRSEIFIDPEERGGLSAKGIILALQMSFYNADNLVFLYSPPGPVSFGDSRRYSQVKDYPSGQLYIFKKREGHENMIDAVALSVGREYEGQVLELFFGRERARFDDQIEKIVYYLSNPRLSDFKDFDQLISKLLEKAEFGFYRNVHGQEFDFYSIVQFLRLGMKGEIKPKNPKVKEIIEKILIDFRKKRSQISVKSSNSFVNHNNLKISFNSFLAYFSVLSAYFSYSNFIALGGSCGGSEISVGEIQDLLTLFNPLSTSWRISDLFKISIIQNEKDNFFTCPNCGGKIPSGKGYEKCPHCGITKDEWAIKSGVRCN